MEPLARKPIGIPIDPLITARRWAEGRRDDRRAARLLTGSSPAPPAGRSPTRAARPDRTPMATPARSVATGEEGRLDPPPPSERAVRAGTWDHRERFMV
jgi:hypothetical protein